MTLLAYHSVKQHKLVHKLMKVITGFKKLLKLGRRAICTEVEILDRPWNTVRICNEFVHVSIYIM